VITNLIDGRAAMSDLPSAGETHLLARENAPMSWLLSLLW